MSERINEGGTEGKGNAWSDLESVSFNDTEESRVPEFLKRSEDVADGALVDSEDDEQSLNRLKEAADQLRARLEPTREEPSDREVRRAMKQFEKDLDQAGEPAKKEKKEGRWSRAVKAFFSTKKKQLKDRKG